LATDPEFEAGWIDSEVTIVPLTTTSATSQPAAAATVEAGTQAPGEVGLRVSSLRSATAGLVSVSPQQSLRYAQSLMMRYDYSQLPVLSGLREERGVVTWESIAQARLRVRVAELHHAITPLVVVELRDDLLPVIPRLVERGFVLVRAGDRTFSGIVTLADISEEFVTLAGPFFLLGEVERRLRRAIDRCISGDTIASAVDPNTSRRVEGADDLSIGEYKRLLESPDNWALMSWEADRTVFLEALETVRQVRNDVMHFSPDPIEEERMDQMRAFLRWLRVLDP